jgi:hypothetical protein
VRNCSAAAPQKKATSSKASQKLSTNDVFAGESQTQKNYKENSRKMAQIPQAAAKRTTQRGSNKADRNKEREREREREDP